MPTFCLTYFQAKKTQNENPHFKEFSGISPNIFGIVGAARNKNRSTKKNMPALRLKYFQKKNIKRKIQL